MSITRQEMRRLQNGSDVRGVAVEGIEGQPVTLTGEAANRIAQAFARWLSAKTRKPAEDLRISVGHDSRISAPALKAEVLGGLRAQKAAALDCGLASTPSMFMSVLFPETACDGAIMITASHLPFNRNGLKFFDADGGLEHADITALLEDAGGLDAAEASLEGIEPVDLLSLYAASLRKKICDGVKAEDYAHPLAGLKIAVDAGNGAGGFFVEQVLKPLGADTSGSRYLDPDGTFPNHIPNPEDKQAMEAVRQATLESHADLGIIDRKSVV